MGIIESVRREARTIIGLNRTLGRIKHLAPDSPRILPDDIETVALRRLDHPAFIFEGRTWSYRALESFANRIANWGRGLGLRSGDSVALFMHNRPEYFGVWYGLSKIGVVSALLNNQLSGPGLAHCLAISEVSHVVVEPELAEAAAAARAQVERPFTLWSLDAAAEGARLLDEALSDASADPPPLSARTGITGKDLALKLFTSGTTGLPKAARMTQMRALNMMHAFSGACDAQPSDRMLAVLPLYHATGGICALGIVLTVGGTVILERKFSASRFWDVAADQKASMFMYVGELCRFLTIAPEHPKERAHTLRCAFGNGLRPDVWERFQARFGIPWILEFYGATEGNVGLVNIDGTVGAVGRVPGYLRHRFNVRLVKFDLDAETPLRGADGLCIETDNDEAGEAIGRIDQSQARFRFDGYHGKAETDKKVLRDVFARGDAWFRTGDLMRRDKLGYLYFVDRIGDTFRWKSENVATSEVAEALGVFAGVDQANVYGVAVPGHDGRAGMAALTVSGELDLAALHAHVHSELPGYARPLFLRLNHGEGEDHTTSTFKLRKVDLQREGFDPALVRDPLYFDDPRVGAYVPLDAALFSDISQGRVRL